MPTNVIDAKGTDKKNAQDQQGVEKTIYIGVFFDGTCNNKYQVMLGKLFRDKQAISTQDDAKRADGQTMTISEVRAKGRDYWKNHGTLSETQLDEIFFGYDSKRSGENANFVEDSFHPVDLMIRADDVEKGGVKDTQYNANLTQRAAQAYGSDARNGLSEKEWENLKEMLGEGGDLQKSTYTNVAVLESLYKSDNNKYFPIYVEGPATVFSADKGGGDKYTVAAAFGEGEAGVWKKVQKAAFAVTRLCQKFLFDEKVKKLKVHVSAFGFSRGATEARMFSHLFNPDQGQIKEALEEVKLQKFLSFTKIEKHLDFAGLFDTVSSYGHYHVFSDDVDQLFLYGVNNADYTLHLCAMDEFRDNFALTDIRSTAAKGLELFMPGCHTDVGGGFNLGVDEWKVISKTPKAKVENPKNEHLVINAYGRSGDSEYYLINASTLAKIGWIPSDALYKDKKGSNIIDDRRIEIYGAAFEENDSDVRFKKYVTPGYSNIPLHLMHKKAVEKSIPFTSIPSSYSVADPLLSRLLGDWKGNLSGCGQKFVSVSDKDYRSLRSKFLHYSANDNPDFKGVVDKLVDGATYVKLDGDFYKRKIITRTIYQGVQDSGKYYYLHEISANPAPPEKKEYYWTSPESEKKELYWTAPK